MEKVPFVCVCVSVSVIVYVCEFESVCQNKEEIYDFSFRCQIGYLPIEQQQQQKQHFGTICMYGGKLTSSKASAMTTTCTILCTPKKTTISFNYEVQHTEYELWSASKKEIVYYIFNLKAKPRYVPTQDF